MGDVSLDIMQTPHSLDPAITPRRPKRVPQLPPKPIPTWISKPKRKEEEETRKTKPQESEFSLKSTYGFVLLMGDHHTIVRGTIQAY